MMPTDIPPPDPGPRNVVAEIWTRPKRVTVEHDPGIGWIVSVVNGPRRRVDTVSIRGDFWTIPGTVTWECEAFKVEVIEVEGLQICAIFCAPAQDPPRSA